MLQYMQKIECTGTKLILRVVLLRLIPYRATQMRAVVTLFLIIYFFIWQSLVERINNLVFPSTATNAFWFPIRTRRGYSRQPTGKQNDKNERTVHAKRRGRLFLALETMCQGKLFGGDRQSLRAIACRV